MAAAGRAAMTATVRAVTKKRMIPTRAPLILTQEAVLQIKKIMSDKPDMNGLKIGVRTRGCNGLSYTLDYVQSKGKFDEEVMQDGVRIFIDSKAQLTLLGTEMDYMTDKLQSQFVFNNPNIKGTCGCGESFNDEKNKKFETATAHCEGTVEVEAARASQPLSPPSLNIRHLKLLAL